MRYATLLLLLATAVNADVVSDAADAVAAAFRAGDEKTLRTYVQPKGFDAWFVLDDLCQRGDADAAAALAALVPGTEGERMRGYVAWLAERAPDPAAAKARAAGRLVHAQPAEALALLDGLRSFGDDVSAFRIHTVRAFALGRLGRLAESEKSSLAAGAVAGRMGWPKARADAFDTAARTAFDDGRHARAAELWQQRIRATAPGRRAALARTYGNLGFALSLLGRYDDAIRTWESGLEHARAAGDQATAARLLGNMGLVWFTRGRADLAETLAQRGLAAAQAARAGVPAAFVLDLMGMILASRGRHDDALRRHEQALTLAQRVGHDMVVARSLDHIARVHIMRGDYAQAERSLEKSLAVERSAATLATLVHLRNLLGDYDRALALGEEGLALATDESQKATLLQRLGDVHLRLRALDRAADYFQRALAVRERRGEPVHSVLALAGLANVLAKRGSYVEALALFERAVGLQEEMGLTTNLPGHLADMALVLERKGDLERAAAGHRRALELNRSLGRRHWIAVNLFNLGRLHLQASRLDEAEAVLHEAKIMSTPAPTRASLLVLEAELRQRRGRPEKSVALLRKAAALVEPTMLGLAEEEGAAVRDAWVPAFARGAEIARMLGDDAAVCSFLERGRAGTLLEDLGGRVAIRAAVVPAELREADAAAMEAARTARARLDAARAAGQRADVRAARETLEAAEERRGALRARMEREAKAGAGLVLGRTATLAEIQACLSPTEALVSYSRSYDDTLALVVRRDAARTVRLAPFPEIAAARDDPAALTRLLVVPLALDADVQRLLVSPFGDLAYVPFALLAGDREIAYVPSGSVYRQLRARSDGAGDGVLALGDPTQKVRPPLPAARAEARAVGSRVLLGDDATAAALREALGTRPRWRALHLACHGRPRALLLADGWLTVPTINGWEIRADLVVLSACDTARGKVYEAEGVLGLPRAFLLAGVPRVIVALWKVDDAATRALMAKFYEVWQTKPTATALREAQMFVRGHEKWREPRFWAAWQLWGLGD